MTEKHQKKWTKEEEDYLVKIYDKLETSEIAKKLGRTEASIRRKADRLNIHKDVEWSDKEVLYLKKWYNKKTITEISKILKRSYNSVQAKAQKMNLCIPKDTERKEWTEEEEDYMERFYGKRGNDFIAKKFNRSVCSIRRKAQSMGLNAYIGEELYVKQVSYCFNCDSRVINRWIDKFNLPYREYIRGTSRCRMINVKSFWKWAENNKNIVPWNKYERYSLLPEPEWVKNVLSTSVDIKHRNPISSYEKSFVIRSRQKGVSFKDIAEELGRTVDSVKHIWRDNNGNNNKQ